jgi:hypothetical protein
LDVLDEICLQSELFAGAGLQVRAYAEKGVKWEKPFYTHKKRRVGRRREERGKITTRP